VKYKLFKEHARRNNKDDDLDVLPALREGSHLNNLEMFHITKETRKCH